MSLKDEQKIEEKIREKVNKLGFEIEYVEDVVEGGKNIIRVVLDKKEDLVTIDDCELVSRSIEDDIDSIIKKEYVLEVSSPGLERQLKNMKLYKKYIGYEIYIKLYKKIDNLKEFIGILQSVNEQDNSICLKVNDAEKILELKISDISSAHTTYDYDKVLSSNKVNLNELKRF